MSGSSTGEASALSQLFRDKIRSVPDFPKPGIVFRDITTLLQDGEVFARAVDAVVAEARATAAEAIVAIESRGFIFGGAVAAQLGLPFIPARKPGKLPWKTVRETYELEYGTDALEIHEDALQPGQKALIVDDLLATGGTAAATVRLVERLGGRVVGVVFLIELSFLKGRDRLDGYPVTTFVDYAGEE